MSTSEPATAACCEVHKLGKCDAVFTCCDKCPTFFGKAAPAASIPYEGTDCTPEEAVEAVKRYRRALRQIADCPNPDSVENCHDQMWDIAQEALGD